jgi:hypothetical protein
MQHFHHRQHNEVGCYLTLSDGSKKKLLSYNHRICIKLQKLKNTVTGGVYLSTYAR